MIGRRNGFGIKLTIDLLEECVQTLYWHAEIPVVESASVRLKR
jgi:hypothetical protein